MEYYSFPLEFIFQLSAKDRKEVITNWDNLPENIKYNLAKPFAITEQGVAMLSGILRSKKAIGVNISIIRVFVLLRQMAFPNKNFQKISRNSKSITIKNLRMLTKPKII